MTPPTSSPAAERLTFIPYRLRWRTYQLVFTIASLGMVPLILSGRNYQWSTIGPLVILSGGFALLAVAQGLLRRSSAVIEGIGLALGLSVFLSRFFRVTRLVASGELPPEALADVFVWAGAIYGAVFVMVPHRLALGVSGLLWAVLSAYSFGVLTRGVVRGLEPSIDLSVSSLVMIVLLSVFRRMVESGARAEARAEALGELAVRDPLTGLFNRRYLGETLAAEFSRAERYDRPLSVALCDIDFFKAVNDTFSHSVGDETLKRVADLLSVTTREADTVARFGGEEFVVVFSETSKEEALKACEELRRVVELHPWEEVHPGLSITLSIGIADNTRASDHETMLHLADTKLYEAKRAGKNQVRT